jgi:tetratricopeptide (TPR) repeat protein
MTDEHPDLEFRPLPEGSLMTFLHDNLVVALDLRDQEGTGEGMDLEGLGEREAAAFPARYAAASAATAAAMDARASLELVTYHGSLGRLASDPAAMARHDREAEEALRAAVRRYGDALQANPRDRIVRDSWSNVETLRLTNGGRALLRQGRPDGAEEAYAAAVAVGTPWNADEAWTGLGRARLRRGRAVAAREALERALALFPGNRDAQALLGEALVALGRPGEARGWFERAYEGGSGPADEDAATREARDAAMRAEASAGGGAGEGGPAAREDREVRAALAGALEEAAGPPGPLRDRAAERVRGAKGREAEVLAELLGPHRRTVLDPAAPGPERVRSLSLLAAARDPGLGDLALALPPALAAEGPYAAAFVDALAEAGEVPGLAGLLDPARGAPPAVRARAADRLAGIRDPRSVDAALAALEDPEASVRTAALAALFRLAGWKEFDPDAPAGARRAAAAALRERWTRARPAWR